MSFSPLLLLLDLLSSPQLLSSSSPPQDVCPWGHLFLGLVSLAPLLLPGLMYSLSTFLHYRGDIMQCGVGKPFNIPSSKLGNPSPPRYPSN